MSSGLHCKWVPATPVVEDWWDSCILAHCLGLCQAWWSLLCAACGRWAWSQGLFVPTGTSVLTTCNYPSMASSSSLRRYQRRYPSCPGDKAHVSAAEQMLLATSCLLHSLSNLRDAGIPLKHHSFELSAALQGSTSVCDMWSCYLLPSSPPPNKSTPEMAAEWF